MDSLKLMEPYLDNAVEVFLTRMTERQGQVVNMGLWVQLFAFGSSSINQYVLKLTFLKILLVKLLSPSGSVSWTPARTTGPFLK
jgi:hypothetical protein